MKKILSCLLAMFIIFSTLVVPSFAEPITVTDKRTGITYEMSYTTYVSGCVKDVEYESNPVKYTGATTYYETFKTDITSDEVQKSIKECNDKYTKALTTAPPSASIIVPFIFLDGYVRTLDNEKTSTWMILKYFGISQNLNGTKTVIKEGIPFTFHGDGKGNIKVEVITDQIGVKTARIELPIERKHWKEERVDTKYSLAYMMKPSVGIGLATGYFDSLEEALDECVEKADLNKKIRIEKQTDYGVSYYGKVYDKYILDIEYGWVDRSEYESTTKPSLDSNASKPSTSKPSTNRPEKTTIADSATEKVDADATETILTTDVSESTTLKETEVNAVVDSGNTETTGNDKNNATPIIIGVVVVAVAGAVAIGVTVTMKKKKK